jgi:hypothetical protein
MPAKPCIKNRIVCHGYCNDVPAEQCPADVVEQLGLGIAPLRFSGFIRER